MMSMRLNLPLAHPTGHDQLEGGFMLYDPRMYQGMVPIRHQLPIRYIDLQATS